MNSTEINQAVDHALALHRAGRLAEAEAAYRALLVVVPALADIHYLLGMACLGQDKQQPALRALRQAVRMKPGQAEWWFNLGKALRQTGDREGALDALSRAIPLYEGQPARQAEALGERGALLAQAGDPAAAETAFRQALEKAPGHADLRRNLAGLLLNRFITPESLTQPAARAALAEATALAPDMEAAWIRRGTASLRMERPAEALGIFDEWLSRHPDCVPALVGRAEALAVLGHFAKAGQTALEAVRLAPASAPALVALAAADHGLGNLAQAEQSLRRALALEPESLAATMNLGTVLRDLGDDAGAEDCYRRALRQAPDLPVAHWQRAQARLMAGDLATGWQEYEWRWQVPGFPLSDALQALPVWNGDGLAPGTGLLVHAEQGHGDSLQFVRYVPMLVERGLDVILHVQPALVRLFRESLPSAVTVAALGSPVPAGIGLRCPLLGLPLRLGTRTLADVPARVPYLMADPVRRARWRDRLSGQPGPRVGLVWAGDGRAGDPRAAAIDRRRSLSLPQLTLLGTVPGVSLISLQKGDRAADAAAVPFPLTDWTAELSDFADTAALVAELDLVIAVDTAVAHLTGGLGVPVWVLSRFDGCWRWLRERRDSPWYPGLQLFRQPAWGDWRPVIADLADELTDWVAARGGASPAKNRELLLLDRSESFDRRHLPMD
ncbi:tetratricopeptide repeat protein [Niveispirillum fermenti]|uniref:tetratricopeptide repeat protein n=1 Tax=Niveispirillum fermenti TaxID=1233113 RepID=UPI003A882999